ncbi:hypothetical protein APR41_08460 [Salegentibacter salinarum]|uniref:DUF5683 domain-containing protein n=1 Tax=Salegentibacter salinarum TaxID=447422 RepID=A0A2N0TQ16_9FLAO|nr:DUF5683 domain-containing protein [Salegentibacter salinarum]PKD16823.1 hypothetical protein APR41_08460 [Salegentibacter salinarum]SKB58306.1 hypothetical protein SAMN05660903_01500 [Salegentibacter salinarum]
MKNNRVLSFLFFLLLVFTLTAQEDSLMVETPVNQDTISEEKDYKPYNALAPAKAAFYSAILPGLGQAYNGRYWKIPLVYAGIGTGVYFYINNNKEWNRYRDAYKDRLAGRKDEFTVNGDQRITDDGLIRAQEFYRRNKEISILVTAGFYVLNIIDANVDAHLQQFNVSEDLTLQPNMELDNYTGKSRYGLSLNYRF